MKNVRVPNQRTKGAKKNSFAKKRTKILFFVNRIMPYVLSILFVITLFSLLGRATGSGNIWGWWANFLNGIFSNFACYFVPIFMLYHALMWYYDVKRKICTRRVICSFVIVVLVSAMQQIIFAIRDANIATYSIPELYRSGKDGLSGGAIGGLIGSLFFNVFGQVFGLILVILLLLIMFLQMFNITPASVARAILHKNGKDAGTIQRERAKKRVATNMKHKKFKVFDEDDEEDNVDEENLENFVDTIETDTKFDDEDNDLSIYSSSGGSAEEFVINKSSSDKDRLSSHSEYSFPKYPEETNEFELGFGGRKSEPKKAGFESYEDDLQKDFDPYVPNVTDDDEPTDDNENDDFISRSNKSQESNNLEDFLSPEVMDKIKTPEKEERLDVEKKSFFGGLIGKKEKRPEKEERKIEEPKEKPVPKKPKIKYVFPPLDFLTADKSDNSIDDNIRAELQENARIIVETLNSFNARTKITDITRGPTVTRYELVPEPGVRVRSIANLADDISLNLASDGLRMECPIPGKSAVGIEVPNKVTSMVYLRSLLEDQKFRDAKSKLTCAVGKTISGENYFIDIEKLPHLLVAGATGMGKSVCINSLLVSLLYKAAPDEVRLILIDPKKVELSNYNGIPHLLVPVVCESKKALGTLQWAVAEMERRFETLEGAGVRNIGEFNDKVDAGNIDAEKMARIVIVIDELYDLKMTAPEVEDYIIRLTQKARAAGMHVIVGTQRPSVDVITGVIKANIPSRIAFRVPALVDSRTILDEAGAEKLVSRGDMLIKPVGALRPVRVQGGFINADEIEKVISFLKEHSSENYDEDVVNQIESNASKLQKAEKRSDMDGDGGADESSLDEKFYAALEIATEMGKISSSLLQRKLGLGFQRAAKIIDTMEEMGYVGEPNGSKPRDVLITKQDFLELRMRNEEEN